MKCSPISLQRVEENLSFHFYVSNLNTHKPDTECLLKLLRMATKSCLSVSVLLRELTREHDITHVQQNQLACYISRRPTVEYWLR